MGLQNSKQMRYNGNVCGGYGMKQWMVSIKKEFHHYNVHTLTKDALAGLTVAAVALPLALAFGVSSGADAGAGLITAIIAGLLIGGLSGASYQISGPTGAMSAILIGLSMHYGLQGVFIAGFLSGILLILASLLKVGKLVSFIPTSVIVGFTSGIAIIIAGGQIDNFFGTVSTGENMIEKIASYGTHGFSIDTTTVLFGLLVIGVMLVWPKKWQKWIPSSLAGIIIALVVNMMGDFSVQEVGVIPSTLLPENRLQLTQIHWGNIQNLLVPAISIAALGMIESLLCGASAGKMKNEKMDANQELLAQGIGNTLLPFFGGVPATAAIARTSVAIKAGGKTRMVSVFHSLSLIASMFLLGPLMSRIPLSALAGVLMMTAWRMNEWTEIRHIFSRRLKSSIAQFLITMIATVVFDLTIAICIGLLVSIILFVANNAELEIEISDIDLKRIDMNLHHPYKHTKLVYLSGPMFFGTQGKLKTMLEKEIHDAEAIILSMRGVPTIDESGIQELKEIAREYRSKSINIVLCGVSKSVKQRMERECIIEEFDAIVWDAIAAISLLDEQYKKGTTS